MERRLHGARDGHGKPLERTRQPSVRALSHRVEQVAAAHPGVDVSRGERFPPPLLQPRAEGQAQRDTTASDILSRSSHHPRCRRRPTPFDPLLGDVRRVPPRRRIPGGAPRRARAGDGSPRRPLGRSERRTDRRYPHVRPENTRARRPKTSSALVNAPKTRRKSRIDGRRCTRRTTRRRKTRRGHRLSLSLRRRPRIARGGAFENRPRRPRGRARRLTRTRFEGCRPRLPAAAPEGPERGTGAADGDGDGDDKRSGGRKSCVASSRRNARRCDGGSRSCARRYERVDVGWGGGH